MSKSYEEQIQKLITRMTLSEKVGQLQQCGPSLVGAFEVSFEELLDMMFDGRISEEEFGRLMSTATQDFHEEDLRLGKIGSYNGIKNAETANKLQKIAVEESRLGIPILIGYDVIHGYRTIFPIPLAEACAWEPKMWEKTARVAAKEATAAGVHMTFAPMVDVAKDARWGRVSEGAGEDTLLASQYGAAKVRGFQGDDLTKEDSMAACVKHFAAYGAAEAGKDYNRVDMSIQRLYEEYLPPYEACVKAGARGIMPAFNDINGVPCSVNRWLLTDVLRNQWGFNGMTVSDANAIAECVNHGIAADKASASKQALEAGMDMDMTSNSYIETVEELVKSGKVKEETLDRAVADILRVKFELGLFDNPYQTSNEREAAELSNPEYRILAREMAEKSIVLLKNDNILPLKRDMHIGIIGELADARGQMTGAWAIGADENDCVSIVDACKAQGVKYTYLNGFADDQVDTQGLASLVESCDAFIVAVGENKDLSGEAASRSDITLPQGQEALLDAVDTLGKPVVTVLFNGRPLAIPHVADTMQAILEAWHPGVEAGNALLNIIFGDVNPSAKLTTTFPYSTGQCPMYYAHINTGRPGGKGKFTSKYLDTPLTPVYPFGYGLSYTTFAYGNLIVEIKEDALKISVDVTNTGSIAGDEIVQCYTHQRVGQRVRPVKQLRAFDKIHLEAGEMKNVQFTLSKRSLGYYNNVMNYVVDAGEYDVYVGTNSEDVLSTCVTL